MSVSVACVGALGLFSAILWSFLVYDSPAHHPRISTEERDYIQKALNTNVDANVCIKQSSNENFVYVAKNASSRWHAFDVLSQAWSLP